MIKTKIAASFILTLLLFSCREGNLGVSTERPPAGQVIIPDSGRDTARREGSSLSIQKEEEEVKAIPSIPIEAKWNIVELMDANLDGDTDDEQLIFLESKEGDKNLEVWVADFNTSANSYVLAWRSELSSKQGDKLTVTVNEAAEQGRYELYVLGYDSRDYHTLDVFYPLSEQSPSFRNIFTQSVKGTIELYYPQTAGSSLSDDYGTRVRISPEIIITRSDPESDNPLDSVITTWELATSPTRYKLISTRKIKATKEQEEKLLELISGPIDDFESLLSDYWYQEEGESGVIRMIDLNKADNTIEFLTLQNYEEYTWDSSHKSSYAPRLYIYTTSPYISSVRKELTINMIDTDSISLDVFDNGKQHRNNSWSGNYKRMTEGMKLSLIKEYGREINTEFYDLKGKYKSASGEEISFDRNSFTLSQEGKDTDRKGFFSLFVLNGEQLLELIYYDNRGMKESRELYQFSYSVEDDEEHRIRSFHITAGETTARGFVPSEEVGRRFEQIELLSD